MRDLKKQIDDLRRILDDEKVLIRVIKKEWRDLQKRFGDQRRTKIEDDVEELKVDLQVTVPSEDVIVTLTKDGYVKRTSIRSYSASSGNDFGKKENDRLIFQKELNTLHTLLLFTNRGQYLYIPVYQLPDIRWKDPGQSVANIVRLEEHEKIVTAVGIEQFDPSVFLTFITKNGYIKKTSLADYQAQRYSRPLMALRLKTEDDEVIHVARTSGDAQIVLFTTYGYGILFSEREVSPVGLRAAGVRGIALKEGDHLVFAHTIEKDQEEPDLFFIRRDGILDTKPLISELEESVRGRRGTKWFGKRGEMRRELLSAGTIESDRYVHFAANQEVLISLDPQNRPHSKIRLFDAEKAQPPFEIIYEIRSP